MNLDFSINDILFILSLCCIIVALILLLLTSLKVLGYSIIGLFSLIFLLTIIIKIVKIKRK